MDIQIDMDKYNGLVKANEEFKNEFDRVMEGVDPNDPDAVCNAFMKNLLSNNSPLAGKLNKLYK